MMSRKSMEGSVNTSSASRSTADQIQREDNGENCDMKGGKESQEKVGGKTNSADVASTQIPLDWRKLFVTNSNQTLQFFPPEVVNGVITIKPPSDVFEEGIKIWQNSLVAQFLGKASNFSSFQRLVSILWGKNRAVEVKLVGENLYIIQFANSEGRDWVLEHGPWHIQNKPVVVRKWEPNMKNLDFNMQKLPVWFHLSHVPLELFTKRGLSYIASALGIHLYMDSITAGQ